MFDLCHATRDELIRTIHDQGDTIADQERVIAALRVERAAIRQTVQTLTARIGTLEQAAGNDDGTAGPPKGMPGLKPTQAEVREARPRKRRAQGAGRRRMEATAQIVHALATCPDYGAPLAGGTVKRTREVLDLPLPRVVVTAHVYLERRCPDCGRRCVPPPDLAGVVSGQRRFGHGLTSLLAVLREEARLPQVSRCRHGRCRRRQAARQGRHPFNDAGFALFDFAALLRFRCASRNLGSTGGFGSLRLSLMFPTTYDLISRGVRRRFGLPGKRTSRLDTALIP